MMSCFFGRFAAFNVLQLLAFCFEFGRFFWEETYMIYFMLQTLVLVILDLM